MAIAKDKQSGVVPTEVSPRPRRRTFTAAYKLRILKEADACTELGSVGALLRSEGLYSSHLTEWRRARDRAAEETMGGKKRGPKPRVPDPRDTRIASLEHDNAGLRAKLRRLELMLELQKKVSELMGDMQPESVGAEQ